MQKTDSSVHARLSNVDYARLLLTMWGIPVKGLWSWSTQRFVGIAKLLLTGRYIRWRLSRIFVGRRNVLSY